MNSLKRLVFTAVLFMALLNIAAHLNKTAVSGGYKMFWDVS
jgi:hypothetical protein